MKLLLYCVFRRPKAPRPPKLLGVDAARVRVVSQGRLSAAVSPVVEAPLIPTVERIQAYERVVEAIFSERTIVPMRFGSLLTSEEEVAEYLRSHEKTLTQLLQKLTGDVEMGIRVAVPPMSSPRKPGTPRGSRLRAGAAKRAGAGHAYLAAAAERVRQDEEPAYDVGRLVGRYRQALRGLFDAVSVQPPATLQVEIGDGGKLQLSSLEGNDSSRRLDGQADLAPSTLALSFLVPKERLDAFREAFNRAARKEEPEAHLSGPWPPYSFVVG